LDLEAFAELLMLPETVAASTGKRVIAILDGFEAVERAIGFDGLGVVRDALLACDRATFLFVGSPRLTGLFGRPTMPLYGLADVVETAGVERGRARGQPPPRPEGDPLAAALLGWAEAPPQPKREERVVEPEITWEQLIERERWRWEEDDDPWRR